MPEVKPGMRVRVWQRLKEGDKWRSVPFEGTVLARKHGKGINATITVRKLAADNVGVEMVFPIHSPLVERIELVQKGKARRAKLYYLRERSRREMRAKLRTQQGSRTSAG